MKKAGVILLGKGLISDQWEYPLWCYPITDNKTLLHWKVLECISLGCDTVFVVVPFEWADFYRRKYTNFFYFADNSNKAIPIIAIPPYRIREIQRRDSQAWRVISSYSFISKSYERITKQPFDSYYFTHDKIAFKLDKNSLDQLSDKSCLISDISFEKEYSMINQKYSNLMYPFYLLKEDLDEIRKKAIDEEIREVYDTTGLTKEQIPHWVTSVVVKLGDDSEKKYQLVHQQDRFSLKRIHYKTLLRYHKFSDDDSIKKKLYSFEISKYKISSLHKFVAECVIGFKFNNFPFGGGIFKSVDFNYLT